MPSRAELLLAEPRVLAIAHRGDSLVAPENTVPAFLSAAALGVDMVELDYHHSADGVPVVFHDATLERTTDAAKHWGETRLKFVERSLAELSTLDAGSWFNAKFAGTRLSTLVDAIEAIHAAGCVTLIERKTGDAATLVKVLAEHDRLGDVIVQAFDWLFLAECKRLVPSLVIGPLGRHEITPQKLDEIVAAGAAFIGWADSDLTRERIAMAHGRGLKVLVFTCDDEARANELISFGIDGLISNAPARIQQVLARTAT